MQQHVVVFNGILNVSFYLSSQQLHQKDINNNENETTRVRMHLITS